MKVVTVPGLHGGATAVEAYERTARAFGKFPGFARLISGPAASAWREGRLVLPGLARPARRGVERFIAEYVAATTGIPAATARAWADAGLSRPHTGAPAPRVSRPATAEECAAVKPRRVVFAHDAATDTRRWRRVRRGETPTVGDLNAAVFGSTHGSPPHIGMRLEVIAEEVDRDTSGDRTEWAHGEPAPEPRITVRGDRGREESVPFADASREVIRQAVDDGFGETIDDALARNAARWAIVQFGPVAFYARVLPGGRWFEMNHRPHYRRAGSQASGFRPGSLPARPQRSAPPTPTQVGPAADAWRHSGDVAFATAAKADPSRFGAAHAAFMAERAAKAAVEAEVAAIVASLPPAPTSATEVLSAFEDWETAKAALGIDAFNTLLAASRGYGG